MTASIETLQHIVDTEIAMLDAQDALGAAGVAQVETPSGAIPAAEERRLAQAQTQARAKLLSARDAHVRALINYRRLTGR